MKGILLAAMLLLVYLSGFSQMSLTIQNKDIYPLSVKIEKPKISVVVPANGEKKLFIAAPLTATHYTLSSNRGSGNGIQQWSIDGKPTNYTLIFKWDRKKSIYISNTIIDFKLDKEKKKF